MTDQAQLDWERTENRRTAKHSALLAAARVWNVDMAKVEHEEHEGVARVVLSTAALFTAWLEDDQ